MLNYSNHFLEQMQLRSLSIKNVEDALQSPDSIVIEDDLTVYQKMIIESNKPYLLRIFVNEHKQPPVAVTVYKTSKIDKYYSS